MAIGFDDARRRQTLARWSVDFADAGRVFDGPAFTFDDTRFAHPEPRIAIDGLPDDRLMAVTRIETAIARRTLSTRKANDRGQARYRHRPA